MYRQISFPYEYLEKQLHNIHHLTVMSSADLVTCIENLAFGFYKYHQKSHYSMASSITPTWDVSLLLAHLVSQGEVLQSLSIRRLSVNFFVLSATPLKPLKIITKLPTYIIRLGL